MFSLPHSQDLQSFPANLLPRHLIPGLYCGTGLFWHSNFSFCCNTWGSCQLAGVTMLAIVQTSTCKLNGACSVMLMMKVLNYWTLCWLERNAVRNCLSVRLWTVQDLFNPLLIPFFIHLVVQTLRSHYLHLVPGMPRETMLKAVLKLR